jgi:putative nucleotidyltransferase with HDIG domain
VPRPVITLDDALSRLAALARSDVISDAYVVGGYVRDALLGRARHDADIVAVEAPTVARAAAGALDSHVVELGGRFPLFRVPLADGSIDVSPMQGSLEADLARRDFTVNTLALSLGALSQRFDAADVIDHHGGLDDLHTRLLRAVTPHALADDPIRALRAARLACELGFDIDASTRAQMRDLAGSLDATAPERVGAELQRLFACLDAFRGVQLLDETGLLGMCFPALEEGRDVEQRPWHLHTVRTHQLQASRWIDVLLAYDVPEEPEARAVWDALWRDTEWPAPRWGAIRDLLDEHAVALRIATLLHDVGKPATRTVEAGGRTRFFGHPELGADLAGAMLTHWRFSNEVVQRVALLIGEHMRPGQVAAPGRPPTARALYRFHRTLGDATADVCFLFLADSLATRGAAHLLPRWPTYVAHVQRIVLWRPAERADEIRRLVDGHAVMRATGLAPGPALGRVLDDIHERAMAGEITSIEEALAAAATLAASETH